MNHQQAQSFERLHAAASVATGNVAVQAEDVRNVLDATAHAFRTMEQMTRELAASRTRQIIDADPPATVPITGDFPAVVAPAPEIRTPAEAGS